MSYSLDPIEANCYPGTSILINKHDIHDADTLLYVEANLVSAKVALLEQRPMPGFFDFSHYKSVHRFLFEDLYEWAGQIRTVNISKKGTRFCPFEQIEQQAILIFERLRRQKHFIGLKKKEFTSEITDFYCMTNNLHPFREGNGRAQRAFVAQLIRHAEYDIDFADIDEDILMIATIQSAGGVTDTLRQIFSETVHSSESDKLKGNK